MAGDLILKAKVCDMLDYMEERLRSYPREQRSGITPRIREAGYEMLEIAADIAGGFYTISSLKAFDKRKNAMNAFVDYSMRRKFITPQNHKTWGAMLVELGKINGGLMNALDKKRRS